MLFGFVLVGSAQQTALVEWRGVLHTNSGDLIAGALIHLGAQIVAGRKGHVNARCTTAKDGYCHVDGLQPGKYDLSVDINQKTFHAAEPVRVSGVDSNLLTITEAGSLFVALPAQNPTAVTTSTGGEELSSQEVSDLPLNKRDISQLLLLAAGTMTDANGATNFTQQFAVNGQRGVEAVFAMDGADITDPEMGGATFSNFNVDAVQEIKSSSGWMPASIGEGAAGFTNIITRSGGNRFHGSIFEFVRNSAFDARNYFDHATATHPERIPPFRRNEFGFTSGGPIPLPRNFASRETFYFGQYQGFRQVLGTTQVFPVPTAAERSGLDTSAFPGDTLIVPVDPAIAKVLSRYPVPNLPNGSFGANTYAASSTVVTNANQFSMRLDRALSDKNHFFIRFNFNDLTGPTTNPDQTAIDPTFGVQYIDHQRTVLIDLTRTISTRRSLQTGLSFTRSTPTFATSNQADPALKFNDGLFEAFNSAAGSVMSAFGNLFQLRQNVSLVTSKHAWMFGAEVRLNRDTTYFGISPNGEYDFGGGTAYARQNIRSASGTHDVLAGQPLPDTLSALLSGSAFVYTVAIAPTYFSNGEHIGPAAINRNAAAAYMQDTWQISDNFVLDYGLRWEIYTPISERAKRTSGFRDIAGTQQFVVNPQPGYKTKLDGWEPRIQLTWRGPGEIRFHGGGALTVIPPNIWQDNFLTGSTPFVIYPRLSATHGAPIAYGFSITPTQLPRTYTPAGNDIFASGDTKAVKPNTVMDVDRYEKDVAALTPSHVVSPLNLSGIDPSFQNAWLYTWSVGAERSFKALTGDLNYVGTVGVRLPRTSFPNAYPGAGEGFAPYTQFDASGAVTGGFGVENIITASSHSTYHALQASLTGNMPHTGPGIQASYTWSKSIDDTSSVSGGSGLTGAVAPAYPQDPFNTRMEKGPSTFDVTHAFTLSLTQDLHVDEWMLLRRLHRQATQGWQLLSISSISSGSPFTVLSGIQQTGYGSNGTDRPDQISTPRLSTNRQKREDYFGKGPNNASFFSIPINLPGGTGPNRGRFGTLGRNTFRGPAFYNYDFSMVKDTPFGKRADGSVRTDLQFRAEFFNLFNIVTMGLPANTISGSGFGLISKTAGNSRQIQFSLKLIY